MRHEDIYKGFCIVYEKNQILFLARLPVFTTARHDQRLARLFLTGSPTGSRFRAGYLGLTVQILSHSPGITKLDKRLFRVCKYVFWICHEETVQNWVCQPVNLSTDKQRMVCQLRRHSKSSQLLISPLHFICGAVSIKIDCAVVNAAWKKFPSALRINFDWRHPRHQRTRLMFDSLRESSDSGSILGETNVNYSFCFLHWHVTYKRILISRRKEYSKLLHRIKSDFSQLEKY